MPATSAGTTRAPGSTSRRSSAPSTLARGPSRSGATGRDGPADQLRRRADRVRAVAQQPGLHRLALRLLDQQLGQRLLDRVHAGVGDVDHGAGIDAPLVGGHAVGAPGDPCAGGLGDRRQHVDRAHRAVVDVARALPGALDDERHAGDVGRVDRVRRAARLARPEGRRRGRRRRRSPRRRRARPRAARPSARRRAGRRTAPAGRGARSAGRPATAGRSSPCSRARRWGPAASGTRARRAGSATRRGGASSGRRRAAGGGAGRPSASTARAKPVAASSSASRASTSRLRPEPPCSPPGSVRPCSNPSHTRSTAGRSRRRSSGRSRCWTTISRSDSSARRRSSVAGRALPQSRSGHRSVIGSTTISSWLSANSENRLRGCWRAVGRFPARGCMPVTWEGTASVVRSSTVVARRYQVPSAASAARFGKSAASIWPDASVIVVTGSSSSTTCTIGTSERAGPATAAVPSPSARRSATGEKTRKSRSTMSGAGESRVANVRAAATRAYSAAASAPSTGAARSASPDPPSRSPTGGSTSAVASNATQHELRRPPGGRPDPSESRHERRTRQRRNEGVAEREQQDVAARAPARDEELGVAGEQAEQRLGERERPQGAEVQRRLREAERARRRVAHIRGRASKHPADAVRARPRRDARGRGTSRARRSAFPVRLERTQFGLVVLADAQQPQQAIPVHLQRDGGSGHAADQQLREQAPGAGIEVAEEGEGGGQQARETTNLVTTAAMRADFVAS